MSWSFHLQKINQSFERIASWYTEFMQRTELCFRALHERLLRLETQQATQGLSDEQLERVLRKILAERFADAGTQPLHDSQDLLDNERFIKHRSKPVAPRAVAFDPALLLVEPDSVPSKVYTETFQMLERRLAHFPHIDSSHDSDEEDEDVRMKFDVKTPPKSMTGA